MLLSPNIDLPVFLRTREGSPISGFYVEMELLYVMQTEVF